MKRLNFLIVLAGFASICHSQERIQDVVYMKSGGAAFTMDVFKPKTSNGAAIIYLVSGGWFSSHEGISPELAAAFTNEGFTVFEVVHGSQPKYIIPEISKQITRAVRFVHANAKKYEIDATRIGICGGSAGGHLSLLEAGKADNGNPDAKDPVEKEPSTVKTVGVFFPPTDFLNFGGTGVMPVSDPKFDVFKPAFGLPTNATTEQVAKIARDASPIYTITPSFPSTLLIHGDADSLVPLQQSEIFRDALTKAGVINELVVIKGGQHGGGTLLQGLPKLVSWFKDKLKLVKTSPE